MPKVIYRFTATLNRPQGACVFKGTADGCRGIADTLFVVGEILRKNDAFENEVSSLKITISPARKSR